MIIAQSPRIGLNLRGLPEPKAVEAGLRAYIHRMDLNWQLIDIGLEISMTMLPNDLDAIISSTSKTDHLAVIGKASCPVINLSRTDKSHTMTSVLFDDVAIGRLAATYARDHAYKRLLVATPRRPKSWVRVRIESCMQHAAQFGLHTEIYHKPADRRDIAAHIQAMQLGRDPTLLFAYHDAEASWLRDIAISGGINIPNELAILGVGNVLQRCEGTEPHLSSIILPWGQLGEQTAITLHRCLHGEQIQRYDVVPLSVQERASTKHMPFADPLVEKAANLIRRNMTTFSMADLAQQLQVDATTLQRHFRSCLNCSPKAYQLQYRLETAARLLREKDDSISSIGRRCGFPSSQAFATAFSKHFHCSPGRYRS